MNFSKKLNKTKFVLFLLLPLVWSPVSGYAMVFDKVVAKVNSEIITLSSVEERAEVIMRKYSSASEPPQKNALLEEALNMIVEEKLQIQAGKKIGFIIDEDAVDAAVEEIKTKNEIPEGQLEIMLEREGRSLESYKNHIRDQIMVSKIARFEIGNRVKISDKAIIKYYKEHQKDLWLDGKVRARHILFIAERGSSKKNRREKLQLAKIVLGELQEGKDFAELAMEHSEDVSASSGGDLGYVERGKMVPEFEEAAFSLKAGQVSGIVETEYGYHIIKAEEVLVGKTLNLKETKERIHQILSMQKQKDAYEEWMNELKESAFIELSLFDTTTTNANWISKSNGKRENKDKANKNSRSKSNHVVPKQKLQKTWEEMYKSVEKSKRGSRAESGATLDTIEQKLTHLKDLRDQMSISEQEYQKRKKRLLNKL
jgi:peptidyl-prolyl cis-trans isomerase SurA